MKRRPFPIVEHAGLANAVSLTGAMLVLFTDLNARGLDSGPADRGEATWSALPSGAALRLPVRVSGGTRLQGCNFTR